MVDKIGSIFFYTIGASLLIAGLYLLFRYGVCPVLMDKYYVYSEYYMHVISGGVLAAAGSMAFIAGRKFEEGYQDSEEE